MTAPTYSSCRTHRLLLPSACLGLADLGTGTGTVAAAQSPSPLTPPGAHGYACRIALAKRWPTERPA